MQTARTKPRVTLRTIAQATGLSLSTVSLSLRGGATLRPETRERVAQAARELGYVPDRAGVRLRTGKTNVIALLLGGAEGSIDFAGQMIQGIGRSLAGTRYHVSVIPELGRDPGPGTVRYILDNRAADGVIITHTGPRDPRVKLLIEAGLPFVSHGRTAFTTPHPYYDFHGERFAEMAVSRLVARGCRRVAMVVGGASTTNYHNLVTAFRHAAQAAGLDAQVLENSGADPAMMRRKGLDLARRADRFDGLVCDSEMGAIALVGGLNEAGLMPGRDVQLVYKQTSGILPTLYPRLDSLGEDIVAAGVELAQLLLQRIAGAPVETLQVLAEPRPQWGD